MIYLENNTNKQKVYIPRAESMVGAGLTAYQKGFNDGVSYQKSLLTSTTISQNGVYTSENGFNSVIVDVDN